MRILTALPSYLESLEVAILCLLVVSPVICQEKPEDWPSSYNVGPYKHVYPPTNLSIDQLACTPNPALNRTCPLFFALIMSFGGAHSNSGVVPGIQVALDHINARTDLLPGYTLHYTLQDSQVSKKNFKFVYGILLLCESEVNLFKKLTVVAKLCIWMNKWHHIAIAEGSVKGVGYQTLL